MINLNGNISMRDPALQGEQTGLYTTQNGNRMNFLIWNDHTNFERPDSVRGAKVLGIEYGVVDPTDRLGDAGNITDKFLNGTILNSSVEGRIEIRNPFLQTTITLDMSDQDHPTRTSETGELEGAGFHNEVWVNFGWTGPMEGDFFVHSTPSLPQQPLWRTEVRLKLCQAGQVKDPLFRATNGLNLWRRSGL
ncbi:MAG: hypothetical protein WKG06_22290 [Segetibacter sp.]